MAQGLGLSVLAWDVLNGGELTGKYAQPGTEPRREQSASPASAAMAEHIGAIAREVGRPPAQVAFNWVRQRSPNIIPLLGARSATQLRENLGYLDWQLTPDQLQRLTDAHLLTPEFPQSFLASDHVHGLIFGTTFDQIVARR
jgi:aryl-alcohol dehydrogenase-like predicted oxidoreductase